MRTVEKKSRVGRPSKKTPAVVAAVCERLAAGETLSAICRDPGMPARSVVNRWIATDEAVSGQVAKARQAGFDAIAEEALRIADTPHMGETVEEDEDGKRRVKTGDMTAHRRLQVWTRLQLLKSWDPKRYGERVQQDVTVSDSLAERLARARERDG